jgi:hypothetical protein
MRGLRALYVMVIETRGHSSSPVARRDGIIHNLSLMIAVTACHSHRDTTWIRAQPVFSFSFVFVFVFMLLVVLTGVSGAASPAGYGQEAVIRCIYAMAAKQPYAI